MNSIPIPKEQVRNIKMAIHLADSEEMITFAPEVEA